MRNQFEQEQVRYRGKEYTVEFEAEWHPQDFEGGGGQSGYTVEVVNITSDGLQALEVGLRDVLKDKLEDMLNDQDRYVSSGFYNEEK